MTTSTTMSATIEAEAGQQSERVGRAWEREHFYRLIWLFPAAFALHIAEESLGFPRWVTHTLGGAMDVRAFYVNNAGFMVLLLVLCALAARTRARWALALLYLWTTAQELCNALFHLYTQVVFNAYSPGLFTAMLLYIPVYAYLLYLALRERMLPRAFFPAAFVVGSAMMAFVVWAGLYHFETPPFCKWAPFACG